MAIITLTTDFGLADPFAGVMKGVILGISPRARIVDISHQVSPFDVSEAAFLIAQSYRFFPKRTVHVMVIDPGVGTSRRPILAEAAGQYFVAPDNGVLSMIYSREKHKVRHVTADRYFLKNVSRTFHGRDVFSPVAAHLAAGVPPARMGRIIRDYMRLYSEQPVRTARRAWTGTILRIDRFGNLITNFVSADFPDIEERPVAISVGLSVVTGVAKSYSECAPGELFAITGSAGYLEIASNQSSAAKLLGCGAGAPVELRIL